ncbi:MAG: hypothetical protein AMXMBFR64_50660 [Myxococcales bacterium]
MKKETAIISVIAVAVVAFMLGRLSVDTATPSKAPTETVKQAADKQAAVVQGAPVGAAGAQGGTAAAQPTQPAQPTGQPAGSVGLAGMPWKGAANPKVVIIEVSEFQCPFCSRVGPTLKQIVEAWPNDVRVYFMHNPLGFHPNAMPAAKASVAAHRQGKFWEFHDLAFANQRELSDANYLKWAQELGLDVEKFKKDMADPAVQTEVERQQKVAVALGARGTPGFFINGELFSGAQPFEKFKEVIEKQLAAANAKGGDWVAVAKESHQQGANFENWVVKGGVPSADAAPPAPSRDAAQPQRPPADPTVWKVAVTEADPHKGKLDALVKVVVFSEFQCPFCSRIKPAFDQIEKTYGEDVAIVFKHNPLPFHKDAPAAAHAAWAAQQQGKFWEMHDKLFANQQTLDEASLEKYATEIGLGLAKWKLDKDSPAAKAKVDADQKLAAEVSAQGTPNSYINGRQVTGAQPFEAFKAVIDEELAKAKALVDGGTPRAKVYDEAIKKGKIFKPLDDTAHELDYKDSPILGKPDAKIKLIEFSDLECPYCGRVGPVLKQVKEMYGDDAAIVFKHFPLSFHKAAMPAAEAAMAAMEQGKFWEFSDKAFENQKELTPENFEKWATELGLDLGKFKASIESGKWKDKIQRDMAEGGKAGVRGTPSLYINGRKFEPSGGMNPQTFKAVIDSEILGK